MARSAPHRPPQLRQDSRPDRLAGLLPEADPILSPIDGDLAQRREDAKETTDVAAWRLCAFARHQSLAEGAIRIASASSPGMLGQTRSCVVYRGAGGATGSRRASADRTSLIG